MTALRRDEGRRVQHGWAEFKCERRGTPLAHSGPFRVPLRSPKEAPARIHLGPVRHTLPLTKVTALMSNSLLLVSTPLPHTYQENGSWDG